MEHRPCLARKHCGRPRFIHRFAGIACLGLSLSGALAGGAQGQVISEFGANLSVSAQPKGIVAGPDGNLWFTAAAGNRIGKVTTAGAITEYGAGISAAASPMGIAAGPDGNLWFTEYYGNRIGKITPAGVVTEYSAGLTVLAQPVGIAPGPDGNLWFTERTANKIGKITPGGVITEYSAGISPGAGLGEITAGPDGNLWFTEQYGSRIGKITTSGVVSEYATGISAGGGPVGIAAGPDGNLWFTEYSGMRIGKITTSGVVTEYGNLLGYLSSIAAGPDGNLWFTDHVGGRIGKSTTAGVITIFSAGISSAAGPYGITAGPDQNMWFTEDNANRIGRITTSTIGLPDSGQTQCDNGSNVLVACSPLNTGNSAVFPRQDGRFGRDAAAMAGALAKVGAGAAGFDYTKVANNGTDLAAGATLGTSATSWACTRDNTTGLLWEVKVLDAYGLRNSNWTYSWYSSDFSSNGGSAGTGSGGTCKTAGRCDTEKYVADVNAATLCGYADWRLPSQRELLTILHRGTNGPSIDTTYFPNTKISNYWSAASYTVDPTRAWVVYFGVGTAYDIAKSATYYVRLVRGGQF